MRVCTGGHEMEGAKPHCGECGATEAATIAKCTGCQGEIAKAKKFCGDCGTPAEPAADLDAAVDGVVSILKARATVEKDLLDLPAAPAVGADPKVTEILKAATVVENGQRLVDPDPLFEATLNGIAASSADARVLATQNLAWHQRHDTANTTLLKAFVAMGHELAHVRDEVAILKGTPRPAKAGPVANDAARTAAAAAAAAHVDDSTYLRGYPLLAKCKAEGVKNPELALTLDEVAQLNQHINLQHSVVEIAKSNRMGLAVRVAQLTGESLPTVH